MRKAIFIVICILLLFIFFLSGCGTPLSEPDSPCKISLNDYGDMQAGITLENSSSFPGEKDFVQFQLPEGITQVIVTLNGIPVMVWGEALSGMQSIPKVPDLASGSFQFKSSSGWGSPVFWRLGAMGQDILMGEANAGYWTDQGCQIRGNLFRCSQSMQCTFYFENWVGIA